jgi:hypothetical protein
MIGREFSPGQAGIGLLSEILFIFKQAMPDNTTDTSETKKLIRSTICVLV